MGRWLPVLAGLLAGCAGSPAIPIPCGDGVCAMDESSESCRVDCPPPAPMSRTYVVSTLDFGERASRTGGLAFGFDLDGMNGGVPSLPCTGAADLTSAITGATGVDNQFAAMVSTQAIEDPPLEERNRPLREPIQSGASLIVLEVADIESFENDASVTVHLALGAVSGGGAPITEGLGLAAGQTFAMRHDLATVSAAIVDHRLVIRTAYLPLSMSTAGSMAPAVATLPLHDVIVGGRIDATGFTEGEIGGAVLVDDLVILVATLIEDVDRETVEALTLPDIAPDADGLHCDAVSMGLGFTAVAATLE